MDVQQNFDGFFTDRMIAQPLSAADLPEYRRLLQDRRVMATLSADGQPLGEEEIAQRLQMGLAHWRQHGFGDWTFRDKRTMEFLGRGGVRRVHIDGQDEVELTYALLPAAWGRGYGTEMAREIVDIAFRQLGLANLVCYTLSTNAASQNVMKKAGFRPEKRIMHMGLPHVFCRLRRPESMRSQTT